LRPRRSIDERWRSDESKESKKRRKNVTRLFVSNDKKLSKRPNARGMRS